eukprot:12709-Heterococcus_DN1.PRE.3
MTTEVQKRHSIGPHKLTIEHAIVGRVTLRVMLSYAALKAHDKLASAAVTNAAQYTQLLHAISDCRRIYYAVKYRQVELKQCLVDTRVSAHNSRVLALLSIVRYRICTTSACARMTT